MYGHMYGYGYGYDHPWMLVGWLWMGLLWLIPILLLIALAKYLLGKKPGAPREEKAEKTPLDILKEAYARGEISRDEYLQKRDDLLEK
jgi:putative membrane protein